MEDMSPKGYEPIDAKVKPVAIFAAILGGIIVLALVATYLMMQFFLTRAGRQEAPVAASIPGGPPAPAPSAAGPAGPRLQSDPIRDMQALRASEDAALSTYGWVDRQAGVVRVPIDRAMEITLQRGLGRLPAGGEPRR